MSNYIHLTKKQQIIFKILLIVSSPFLTLLLSNRFNKTMILIGALLSFLIAIPVVIKFIDLKKINDKRLILSSIIGLYTIRILLGFSKTNITALKKILSFDTATIKNIIGILSIPATIYIIYIFIDLFWDKIKLFFKKLSKTEKLYLKIVMVISVIVSITLTCSTTAFTKPIYNNSITKYDVIYTSDTGTLTKSNAYINVSHEENDIRQPLFGVFALPFSIPTKIISEFLFFLPNAYEICLTITQFFLTSIATILIGRMLGLEEKDKKYLYILFSCSFPYIIFNLVLEQYVISLFYLILALYIYITKKQKSINYFYVPAVGTLLTTGIIFPVITKFKNIKQWIIDIIKCGLVFVSFIIIGGQLPQGYELIERYYYFSTRFVGKVTFTERLYQFTNFIKGIFISIPGKIVQLPDHPSYQLITFKTISVIGIIILLICLISSVLNRKNKFSIIAGLWLVFSIILLLIIGWGTVENGLILYSLYFAWAYLSLYFMFIKKVFKNRKVFISIIIITSIIMLIFNISELINIIRFAIKYY